MLRVLFTWSSRVHARATVPNRHHLRGKRAELASATALHTRPPRIYYSMATK